MSLGKGSTDTIGYNYLVGVHMAICHGRIDKIKKIWVDKKVAFNGNHTEGSLYIDKPDLFGGNMREGGIVGTLNLLSGSTTQTPNSYLVGVLGSYVPAFRRVATVVLEKMNLGMNPYLKPWAFFTQRIHYINSGDDTQWQNSLAQIDVTVQDSDGSDVTIAAMNPAHIIRECLTDTVWGMGYQSSDIDSTSFLAAAQTLYDDGFGLCIIWDTNNTIEEFIKVILKHIDASLYVDRKTGKFVLKLIRDDYDIGTLITLDESNVESMTDPKIPTLSELCNYLTITYHDVLNNTNATISAQELALMQDQNGNGIATSATYEGIVDPTTAGKVISRDLIVLSTPLFSCTLKASKVARDLNVGDVFILNWPDPYITSLVMRVTEINYGTDTEFGVTLKCVQDVFSYPTSAFVTRPITDWEDPKTPPGIPRYQIAFELPYYSMIKHSSQTAVDSALATNPYLGLVGGSACRPSSGGAALNAQLWTDPGSGYSAMDVLNFAPGGLLAADLDYLDTSVTLTDYADLGYVVTNTWLQIDDELMAVTAIAGDTLTVKRGALDTTPQQHTAGALVVVWDTKEGFDPTDYVSSDTVDIKILAANSSGINAIGDVTASTVNVVGRAIRPFLPGKIQFDATYYPPLTTEFSADISMTWAERNRVLETGGTLVGFTDSGLTPEAGTTYEIKLYDIDDVLQYTYTGISGSGYTIPSVDFLTMSDRMTVKLIAQRDGIDSFQEFSYTLAIPASAELTEAGDTITTEAGDTLALEI